MLELCRVTPHGYRLALEGSDYGDEDLACEANVGSKQWDILSRILANGQLANPPLAAQAICGGTALKDAYGIAPVQADRAGPYLAGRSMTATPAVDPAPPDAAREERAADRAGPAAAGRGVHRGRR